MKIYNIKDINKVLNLNRDLNELLKNQKKAFIDYSLGLINVPLPMQFEFYNPFGDCHIKGASSNEYNNFVIKISSGFYDTVPTGDGIILVLSRKTGLIEAIMHDEGYLTTLRTSLAACLASKITPFKIEHIGIIGSGKLAHQIIQLLELLYPDVKFSTWGRNYEKSQLLASQYHNMTPVSNVSNLIINNGVIITTTASDSPIVKLNDINCRNLHIIGLGADCVGKQELESQIFGLTNKIIVDSKNQATKFGDTYNSIQSGVIMPSQLIEFGHILNGETNSTEKDNFLISNFTGIGAQDLAISEFIHDKLIAEIH